LVDKKEQQQLLAIVNVNVNSDVDNEKEGLKKALGGLGEKIVRYSALLRDFMPHQQNSHHFR
jgi:hypothetical protein